MPFQFLVRDRTEIGVDEVSFRFLLDRGKELISQRGDTVLFVEEIVARVIVGSEIILVFTRRFHKRCFCFRVPDIFPDFCRIDFLVQITIWQKQGLSQILEGDVSTGAFHSLLAAAIAINHALNALGGDIVGVVHHLHEDEPAMTTVCLIHVKNRMSGRT